MTLADHLTPLAEGVLGPRPVSDQVRVRVTKDSISFDLTLRDDGEPVNWPSELEILCGDRRPTFVNLIKAGFTITAAPGDERG